MEIRCSQCGAALTVASDVRLLQCSFCATALIIDAGGVLFHEVMMPTVRPDMAAAHLRRFLASDATVANLDREARLDEPLLEYFPFWAFSIAAPGGEQVILEPAAPSSLQGLQGLALPAGEVRSMSPEVTGAVPVREPEVPLATARDWLVNRHGQVAIRKTVLYHLPIYRIGYSWQGKSYSAGIDAVSGKVFPADFPAKAEAPYLLVAGLALLVFGVEGLIVSNLLVKALLYVVSAVPILGLAWLTTRKV